ncbi:MAG: Si-specific NAD(P)(+) transhydrogenase [Acidimicrobiia bacterium]
MPTHDYDLVCIGSGPAGQRAAVQATKVGKRALIVERDPPVGGACLQTGTIPSKSLREAVQAITAENAGRGLVPHAAPVPTTGELRSRVAEVIEAEARVQVEQLRRNRVAMHIGTASFVDEHTLEIAAPESTTRVSADNILIAVGSRPARPDGIEIDGRTVLVSDDLLDLESQPQRIVVIGGGVIGLELASMFATLGAKVTVVDQRERLLEFLDDEISDELISQLRHQRVTFRLGERVERVTTVTEPHPQGLVELESGKSIVEDMVLFSAGREANTDSLNLGAIGVGTDTHGRITVDDAYRTTTPNVYAAGDVLGFPALASTSAEQGRLAACHMFGVASRPMADRFPIGIYSIPEISMIGANEAELTSDRIPYETGVARYSELVRGQLLNDEKGLVKMLFHRDTGRLLGVHIIGSGATELLHVGQAVFILGGGLDYFLENVFNYPTLAEAYKVAALDAANKLQAVARFRERSV